MCWWGCGAGEEAVGEGSSRCDGEGRLRQTVKMPGWDQTRCKTAYLVMYLTPTRVLGVTMALLGMRTLNSERL